MADDNPPPPLMLGPRTTTEILHHTTTIFSARHHLRIFLTLSFLLFVLRFYGEKLTLFVTSYVDNNHELESLLSRVQPPPKPISNTTITTHRNRHHHPLFELTPFGILEDDYYPVDDELDHQPNVTSFVLDSFNPHYGFRSGKIINKVYETDTIINNDSVIYNNDSVINNVELEDHEVNTMMSFIWVIFRSYLAIFLASVSIHICVHGVVFVMVVNDFLNRHDRNEHALGLGVVLGSRRLVWLVLLRWVVRYVLSLVLGCLVFKEVVDPYLWIKIMVRLMFMPFSTVSPWVKGFELDFIRFIIAWFSFDILVSFGFFSLQAWVALADRPRRTRMGVIKEGYRLLPVMIDPAVNLKWLQILGCGWFVGNILTYIFGKVRAYMYLCVVEVYFMVAWMMHYVSVKSMDAWFNGQPFDRRELEVMLER
ncbi:hypothetical protein QVD17_11608 [Tagetes erecta]|uniref:Transmembrane protein n=1 Tax=Tagetes erecta TaxID=13708 RepID=A0AAD8KVH1_TARER|nr:hypothetical protein QVD17_11608 [Tagetes erecta]